MMTTTMIWMRTRRMMMKAPLLPPTVLRVWIRIAVTVTCVGGAAAQNRQDAQRHAADRGRFERRGVLRRVARHVAAAVSWAPKSEEQPPIVGVAPQQKKRREDSSASSDSSDDDDSFRAAGRGARIVSASPPPVFGGGAGRFAAPPFGRHAPAPLVVKKIEWSPDRAAAARVHARACPPGRRPRSKGRWWWYLKILRRSRASRSGRSEHAVRAHG